MQNDCKKKNKLFEHTIITVLFTYNYESEAKKVGRASVNFAVDQSEQNARPMLGS